MAFGSWLRKTPPLAPGLRLRHSPHVLSATQGDDLVLLDTKRERFFTLNEVGARAWSLLGDGATRRQIVEAIRREYDVPAGTEGDPVEGDVERLLQALHAAGLVVADPQAPGDR